MACDRKQGGCHLFLHGLLQQLHEVRFHSVWQARFAKSLLKLGLKKKDVCGIIGFNSPEYYFSLQGTWMADCVTAGIYTTNSPEACEYVLKHSEAKVCVCQSGKSAMKICQVRDNLPLLKAIVVYWPEDDMPSLADKEGVLACSAGRLTRSLQSSTRGTIF